MQYAIIGAGGTGGVMGYFMTKAGKDVTLIARGRHLEAMKEHGLTLERLWDPNPETIAVKTTDMEHYEEQPDVILVCVKEYSLEDTVPFIRRVAKQMCIRDRDLTCPKCCTIIQIVDSTTNRQIFYKKQKEKSISEERMGYFLWMIQNGRSRK